MNSPCRLRGTWAAILPPMVAAALAAQAAGDDYAAWAANWFQPAERTAGMAAPRHDPDRDGWPNLLEFLTARNPRSAGSKPVVEFDTGDPAAPLARAPLASPDPAAGVRILVSADLVNWTEAAAAKPAGGFLSAPLGGCRFVRLEGFALPGIALDSDADGLHDLFEEQLAAANPHDAHQDIGSIRPADDFDGDGIPNISEPANLAPAGSGFPWPPLLDPAAVAAAADRSSPAAVTVLAVHTPLR